MAKLDPTVIYGTLNINGELTTRKSAVKSKGTWFVSDLETAGYTSFTTNAVNGYKFDKGMYTNGNIHISKTNGRLIIEETAYASGNSGLEFKTVGANQHLAVLHEVTDNETIGSINGQILTIKQTTTGHIAGLEVEGEIYSQSGKVWHSGNDGAGSGMDTDLFNGLQSTQFLRSDQSGTLTGDLHCSGALSATGNISSSKYYRQYDYDDGHGSANYVQSYLRNNTLVVNGAGTASLFEMTIRGHKVWHAGNDGPGSGMNTDLFDSLNSSQFVRSDANDTISGALTITGALTISNTATITGASTITGDMTLGNYLIRSGHSKGYLVGSYNSVGANHAKTNPIYTIGTSYKPTDDSLGNMYGIGYCSAGSVSFLSGANSSGANGWGMYVASGGAAKIFLDAANGKIWSSGAIYESGTSLSSRYLGISAKAHDSNLLDGINSASFIRSDVADTFLKLNATGDKYHSAGDYGIHMMNSDIIGCNGIWFGDTSTTNEGLMFLKDGGNASVVTDYTVFQVRGNGLGYIGSKVISTTDHSHPYMPLAGGTFTGNIVLNDKYLYFGSASGSRAYISGRKLGGNSNGNLELGSDDTITFVETDSNAEAGHISCNSKTLTMLGNITAYSDERIKSNIEKIENPLEKIGQINGYTFERDDLNNKRDTGVLAQEVEKVLPEVIVEVDSDLVDGKLKTVDYGKLSGLLIECVKELKKEINELKGLV